MHLVQVHQFGATVKEAITPEETSRSQGCDSSRGPWQTPAVSPGQLAE